MNTRLIQRIRGKKNQPIGVLSARKENQIVGIGWSLCNRKDVFNFEKGIRIADLRAQLELTTNVVLPIESIDYTVTRQYDDFIERSSRYFKTPLVSNKK